MRKKNARRSGIYFFLFKIIINSRWKRQNHWILIDRCRTSLSFFLRQVIDHEEVSLRSSRMSETDLWTRSKLTYLDEIWWMIMKIKKERNEKFDLISNSSWNVIEHKENRTKEKKSLPFIIKHLFWSVSINDNKYMLHWECPWIQRKGRNHPTMTSQFSWSYFVNINSMFFGQSDRYCILMNINRVYILLICYCIRVEWFDGTMEEER